MKYSLGRTCWKSENYLFFLCNKLTIAILLQYAWCSVTHVCVYIYDLFVGARESFRFRRRSTSDAYEKTAGQNRPSPSSPFDVWEMSACVIAFSSVDDWKCFVFPLAVIHFCLISFCALWGLCNYIVIMRVSCVVWHLGL